MGNILKLATYCNTKPTDSFSLDCYTEMFSCMTARRQRVEENSISSDSTCVTVLDRRQTGLSLTTNSMVKEAEKLDKWAASNNMCLSEEKNK